MSIRISSVLTGTDVWQPCSPVINKTLFRIEGLKVITHILINEYLEIVTANICNLSVIYVHLLTNTIKKNTEVKLF